MEYSYCMKIQKKILIFFTAQKIHTCTDKSVRLATLTNNWWEFWQIPYVKVSSRNYSSIYARTPENVDEYAVFTYSWRIDVCVDTALFKNTGKLRLTFTQNSFNIFSQLLFPQKFLNNIFFFKYTKYNGIYSTFLKNLSNFCSFFNSNKFK